MAKIPYERIMTTIERDWLTQIVEGTENSLHPLFESRDSFNMVKLSN